MRRRADEYRPHAPTSAARLAGLLALLTGITAALAFDGHPSAFAHPGRDDVDLGSFSISLSVEDIEASRAFYEAMGFEVIDGRQEDNWLILRNGEAKIGLFQGLFDANVITFNPPDVRAAQRAMKARGIAFVLEADEATEGPAHATLLDPDGNPVLLDQH